MCSDTFLFEELSTYYPMLSIHELEGYPNLEKSIKGPAWKRFSYHA